MGKEIAETVSGYENVLKELKEKIQHAQAKAMLAVNQELICLYWEIGRQILHQEENKGWGAKVVDQLATDLRKAFPNLKGFSARNLRYMKSFADAYADLAILQAGPAKLTWYHNCTILDKVKASAERQWYVQETIKSGWTRDILVHQIESGLYRRQGKAITNFATALPKPQSELVRQILKDPYNFDFLDLAPESLEKELERSLIEKLKDFLLELGAGFAFVGSQYHLEVAGQDFFLDLLFYHLRARCFVVVDLKITEFKPEYVGKMNFYLSAVDELLKHETDQLTVGLILCKTKNNVIAEYTLRNSASPVGVSEYRLANLPNEIKNDLPSIALLEEKLATILEDAPAKSDGIAANEIGFDDEIEWIEKSGDVVAQIGDFTLSLRPQTGGRWHVDVSHKDGYSHSWPPWQRGLDAAKATALKCFKDASEFVSEQQTEHYIQREKHAEDGWDWQADGSFQKVVSGSTITIEPRSGGRWQINIVDENGNSPAWLKWQPDLESAKQAAISCAANFKEARELD
jgi:predicted nuclease of restriction endonuclease-like (RecB) superfamily